VKWHQESQLKDESIFLDGSTKAQYLIRLLTSFFIDLSVDQLRELSRGVVNAYLDNDGNRSMIDASPDMPEV
jgi:hypothetical protein